MTLCPCGSGRELTDCCGPIVDGAPAPTPEALMRSRYSAFVLGKLDHIDRTHAPEIRADFNRAEAERTVAEVEWLGLDIRQASEDGDSGSVEFGIRFRRDGQDLVQHEVSSFRRVDGEWLYEGGQVSPKAPPRQVVKIGRNDPCPCGSGKKHKKCCGA
ncbi:MAG: YchJ family metal-binding protein [Sulfurimicrobium sp.]|nr:YchJ family metal-binding protein [Sulfurimicrobium sp.]